MTTTERTFTIKRALLQILADCGNFAVREDSLRDNLSLRLDYLSPTTAEIDAGLRAIDIERLAVALPSERGRKLKLTDAGRLWLAENAS